MALVKELMTERLVVVSPELTLRDLIDLLTAEHVSGAPVISAGRPVGIITLDDVVSFQASLPVVPVGGSDEIAWEEAAVWEGAIDPDPVAWSFQDSWEEIGADLPEQFADGGAPEWDLLGEHTVDEAMSRRLMTVRPDDTAVEAARRMTSAGIHRLLVLDQNRLCGIVTTTDITRAVAEGRV